MGQKYFLERTGWEREELSLRGLRDVVFSIFTELDRQDYFFDFLGGTNSIGATSPGRIGHDFKAYTLRKIGKALPHPRDIDGHRKYQEADLFSLIELLYENIVYPEYWVSGSAQDWIWCQEAGQDQFRSEVNQCLRLYAKGWELTDIGYIRELTEDYYVELLDQTALYGDEKNVDSRIRFAKKQFLQYGSGLEEKKNAIREIGDALEYIRKDLKQTLPKEEDDIFNILNRFGIRHHNEKQLSEYDAAIYYPWIFYTFLSCYDAFVKLKGRNQG